jgi:pimeloyl-ACP methyl ester carboxylesterase
VWSVLLERSAERRYPRLGALVRVRPELGETAAPSVWLHYLEAGAGPPVVLLHGAFGGSQDWSATIMGTLAARYRVIAFDRPGHGYSERVPGRVNDPRVQAEAVRAALHELRVERPVLVGFSWGGTVALAYAVDHQGELGALVTVNAASHGKDEPTGLIYRIPSIPIVGPLFEHTFVLPFGRAVARSEAARAFGPEAVPDSFADSPLDLALTPGRFAANAEDSVILDACAREQSKRYDQLTLPTWILVGEGDLIVSPRLHAHRLHEQVSGSHLVSIEGAGHQLLYRHAKEIVEAIDAAAQSPAHAR